MSEREGVLVCTWECKLPLTICVWPPTQLFSTCPIMHWALALAAFVLHSSVYVLVELLSFAKKVNKGRKKKCTCFSSSLYMNSITFVCHWCIAIFCIRRAEWAGHNNNFWMWEACRKEKRTCPLFTLFCLILKWTDNKGWNKLQYKLEQFNNRK